MLCQVGETVPYFSIMLSYLDPIIFPDECEVLELPNGRYVYPIYKNGSSSLHSMNLPVVKSIADLTEIDVYIREPHKRFLSGVNTYLEHLDPALDRATALYFVKNYLFLNRHYCPQFYWLVNLRRFTTAKIRLLPFSSITEVVDINKNKSKEDYYKLDSEFTDKLDFYLQLDKILYYDFINKTVSIEDIIEFIKINNPDIYKEIIQRSIDICNVLG